MFEDNNFNNENLTRFKDIDEGFRFKIIEFISDANKCRNDGDIIKGYKWMRSIFEIIQPSNFKHKETLSQYTKEINFYINELGVKPVDMQHKFKIANQEFELKELIDDYFNLIPFCLEELNLYLRFIKRKDDPDEQFSEDTFNINTSLLDYKKKLLCSLEVKDLLDFMTPRQVHDVHARILLEVSLRKKLPEEEEVEKSD